MIAAIVSVRICGAGKLGLNGFTIQRASGCLAAAEANDERCAGLRDRYRGVRDRGKKISTGSYRGMPGSFVNFPSAIYRERSIQAATTSQDSHQAEQGQSHQKNIRNDEVAVRVRNCVLSLFKSSGGRPRPPLRERDALGTAGGTPALLNPTAAGERRPRSSCPATCATDASRSARLWPPWLSSWSALQARPRRTRRPVAASGRRAGNCDR